MLCSARQLPNYLAADRIDVQLGAKEVCRWMAKPTQHACNALKRFCRYLVGLPRLVFRCDFQHAGSAEVYADTGWAR